MCGENEITIFLDTGSPINLITYDELHMMMKTKSTYKKVTFMDESDIDLFTVDGNNLPVIGTTEISFRFNNTTKEIKARFYIVKKLEIQATMLVGLRTMRTENIVLMPHIDGIEYDREFIEEFHTHTDIPWGEFLGTGVRNR